MKTTTAFMATLTIFTTSILSINSFAGDAHMLTAKIERQLKRVNKMVNRGKLQNLNRRDLKDIKVALEDIVLIMGGQLSSAPTPPRPSFQMTAEGYIENSHFKFTGENPGQIFNSCVGHLETKSGTFKADDVYISINGAAPKHKNNSSSWWRTADEVCSVIEAEAINLGDSQSPTYFSTVTGRVENSQINLEGANPMALFNQCIDQIPSSTKADDIHISTNGSRREHLRNSSSWWKGNKSICSVVISKL